MIKLKAFVRNPNLWMFFLSLGVLLLMRHIHYATWWVFLLPTVGFILLAVLDTFVWKTFEHPKQSEHGDANGK